ncbi:MAG: hypothetical protein K6T30_04935 [Alicyclobacillus sp.]|nr:hypothetical protein [Alicyclobacillus sp.]
MKRRGKGAGAAGGRVRPADEGFDKPAWALGLPEASAESANEAAATLIRGARGPADGGRRSGQGARPASKDAPDAVTLQERLAPNVREQLLQWKRQAEQSAPVSGAAGGSPSRRRDSSRLNGGMGAGGPETGGSARGAQPGRRVASELRGGERQEGPSGDPSFAELFDPQEDDGTSFAELLDSSRLDWRRFKEDESAPGSPRVPNRDQRSSGSLGVPGSKRHFP